MKKAFKQILSAALAAAIVLSLAACGQSSSSASVSQTEATVTETTAPQTEATTAETTAAENTAAAAEDWRERPVAHFVSLPDHQQPVRPLRPYPVRPHGRDRRW